MTIYRIANDGFKYQVLDLEVNDFIDSFPEEFSYQDCHRFDRLNITMESFWPPMKTKLKEIVAAENLVPEISLWHGTTLALSPSAYKYTYDSLRSYGEFLPIQVGQEVWHLFNCTSVAELDASQSDENTIVFDKRSVSNKLIFKCIVTEGLGLYCSELFMDIIAEYGLQGLSFQTQRDLFYGEFKQKFLQN